LGNVIQKLIREGVIVLYQDFRSGCAKDWSGNSNDGTLAGTEWARNGLRFPASVSKVTVPDSAELQLTAMTIIAYSENQFNTAQLASERIVSKRDAGGTNYDLYLTPVAITVFDGVGLPKLTIAYASNNCIAVNISDGSNPDVYLDGTFSGAMDIAAAITVNDAALILGNDYNGPDRLNSSLSSVLICNRELTAGEHSDIYDELVETTWASKTHTNAPVFKTDWGYKESPENEGGTIHQQIGGIGSPFRAGDTTGRWSIEYEEVNGKTCKVLECKTSGSVYILTSEYHGVSETGAAYGTWEWWLYQDSGNTPIVGFISLTTNGVVAGSGYYNFIEPAGQRLRFWEPGGSSELFSSINGSISADTWCRYTVKRTLVGEFSTYADGILMTAASGSNPVTDNTKTSSKYLVFNLDAGDKICLGDRTGDQAVIKYEEVV